MDSKKTVKDWKDYDFESWDVPSKYYGDYAPANYCKGEFLPVVRKELKAIGKKINANEVTVKYNYFEINGMIKKSGHLIYVKLGDVRWGNWYDSIMCRAMAHDKDWGGIWTEHCSWNDLETTLQEMFDRERVWKR